jgi:hypothetical protein
MEKIKYLITKEKNRVLYNLATEKYQKNGQLLVNGIMHLLHPMNQF